MPIERKAASGVMREAREVDHEHPPRNLLLHPDETRDAMAEIEGERWLEDQQQSVGQNMLTNTLEGALRWLRGGENDSGGSMGYIVYGSGGVNRWFVRPDGTVRFSMRHGEKKAEDAAAAGFEIAK